jgi:hypothetical protein
MATTSPSISREGAHGRDARAPQSHSSEAEHCAGHWTRKEGGKGPCVWIARRLTDRASTLLACSRLLAPTAS